MVRSSRSLSIRFLLALLLPALIIAVAPAQAQVVKPFKIVGVGAGPDGLPLPGQPARPHWVVGVATHLGLHCGEGTVQTDSAFIDFDHGIITGEFGGGSPFVFTGANGDQLATWYGRTDHGASEPGTFTLTILDILPDGQPRGRGGLDCRVRRPARPVHRQVRRRDRKLDHVRLLCAVRPGHGRSRRVLVGGSRAAHLPQRPVRQAGRRRR